MFDWLFIQTIPNPNNNENWLARWRGDNYWKEGRTKAQAILKLKESSWI